MNNGGGAATVDTDPQLRVALVTQWFPPEPAHQPMWMAKALARRGVNVRVLTGVPNYPTGKIAEGYSAWHRSRETREGVRIHRSPLFPSHDGSAVGRISNYLSFAATASVSGKGLLRTADATLVYGSPVTTALPAMAARLRYGTPYVLYVPDLWPDSVFASGFLNDGLSRLAAEAGLTAVVTQAYRLASHVAVTTPGMVDRLIERGVPRHKVSLVYNWVDTDVMRPAPPDPTLRRQWGGDDAFVVMYGGNHGPAQALDVVVRALGQLADHPKLRFVLVGDGVSKPGLQALASELELRNIRFLDPVAPERMSEYMASADLQLVTLADQPLFQITLPSKLQAIMACGQPILSCAPGDSGRLVADAGAGIVAKAGDTDDIARALRVAVEIPRSELKAMGRSGHSYYLGTLSEEVNGSALVRLLGEASHVQRGILDG